jgi:hypothetical protein
MIAITVTQIIKDLNVELFKNDTVGNIRQLKEIPKSLFSPTYFSGQRTDGYQTLLTSTHEADGFFNILVPVYDSVTQRLGALFFDVDNFTYPVEAIPQAELDAAVVKAVKDEFKNNLTGVFAFATTPDGLNDYAIKIGNDGKIVTVLIP